MIPYSILSTLLSLIILDYQQSAATEQLHQHLTIADSNKNIPAQSAQVEYLQFIRSTYGRQNLTEIAEEFDLKNFEQNFTEFQVNRMKFSS